MKIGMQTWGSHGDIRPFIALAEGLQKAGHEVTLAITCVGTSHYDSLVSQAGVRYWLVGSPVVADDLELFKVGDMVSKENHALKQLDILIAKLFLPVMDEVYAASEELCKNNDLVIGHFFQFPLRTAAKIHKTPQANVYLAHNVLPTNDYPPDGFFNLGKISNMIIWQAVRFMFNRSVKKYADALQVAQGLKPLKDFLREAWSCDELNLIAVSPVLCPRPSGWPASYEICGFQDMPNMSAEGTLSPELDSFLQSGPAPVFMSFGSFTPSTMEAQKKMMEMFIAAAAISNCRAIIHAPHWQETGLEISDDYFFVSGAPHAILFPRCQAVIHHGGAGTTQTATIAGIPSIVVYFISEQRFWASQLKRAGLLLDFFAYKNITSKKLGKAIQNILKNPPLTEKVKSVSEKMKHENGVEKAVQIIQDRFL